MPKSKGAKEPRRIKKINRLRLAVIIAAVLVIAGVLSGVGLLVQASQGLPEVIDLKERLSSTSFIYNEDG